MFDDITGDVISPVMFWVGFLHLIGSLSALSTWQVVFLSRKLPLVPASALCTNPPVCKVESLLELLSSPSPFIPLQVSVRWF